MYNVHVVTYYSIAVALNTNVNRGILNDAWEAQRASCFCDITRVCHLLMRWYANVLQLHALLEVELDHGRGGSIGKPNVQAAFVILRTFVTC